MAIRRRTRFALRRTHALLVTAALASACDRLKWEDEHLERGVDTDALLPAVEAKAKAEPPSPDLRPLDPGNLPPLERSKKKLVFPAKGATHLGFNLQSVEGLHALAGAIEIPDWAAPGTGDTRAMRDDDLGDGWECEPAPDQPCAIGMHLATPAQLRAVRLFPFAPGTKAQGEHRHIEKVRMHTDGGWVEAELPEDVGHAYVVLGKPIETRSVIIEVMSTRGRDKGTIFVADFEVYGTGGTARDPIELDPAKMVVRTDAGWSKIHDGWAHGPAFLETLGDDGKTRRVLPGTAVYGRASDRVQLVELLDSTDCQTHRGSYFMLDRVSRVLAPVGDLGGMGGQIFRARAGNGFASGYVDEGIARLSGIVLEGDSYKHRRTQRASDIEGPALLVSWEMESEPTPRGGAPINRPLPDCALGADDTVAALPKAGASKAIDKPGEWMICGMGGGVRAFVTDHGPCGKSWELVVLGANDEVIASRGAKRKGARLRLRRWSADALLVELGGDDDVKELFRVGTKSIDALGKLALAVDPPPACRNRCDDALRNPAQP